MTSTICQKVLWPWCFVTLHPPFRATVGFCWCLAGACLLNSCLEQRQACLPLDGASENLFKPNCKEPYKTKPRKNPSWCVMGAWSRLRSEPGASCQKHSRLQSLSGCLTELNFLYLRAQEPFELEPSPKSFLPTYHNRFSSWGKWSPVLQLIHSDLAGHQSRRGVLVCHRVVLFCSTLQEQGSAETSQGKHAVGSITLWLSFHCHLQKNHPTCKKQAGDLPHSGNTGDVVRNWSYPAVRFPASRCKPPAVELMGDEWLILSSGNLSQLRMNRGAVALHDYIDWESVSLTEL